MGQGLHCDLQASHPSPLCQRPLIKGSSCSQAAVVLDSHSTYMEQSQPLFLQLALGNLSMDSLESRTKECDRCGPQTISEVA